MNFDKNIPIPANKRSGWPKQYHFDKMEIGDSQEFPLGKRDVINSTAQRTKRIRGFRFTIKKTGDKIRIWRTG